MIVDDHSHPFGNPNLNLSKYVKSKRDAVILRWTHPDVWDSLVSGSEDPDMTDLMLKDMDANGIDRAIIQGMTGPHQNEAVSKAVKRHPDRFVGLFLVAADYIRGHPRSAKGFRPVVDLGDINEFVGHCVKTLGLRGCGETSAHQFSTETAPEKLANDLFPLMEALAKYKISVMFPTAWSKFGHYIAQRVPFFVDNLAERFPDVPIIITKMGRGYSFLFEISLMVAYKHVNVYLDTVHTIPEHLCRAVNELGADRVMFGTDWDPAWRTDSQIYPHALEIVQKSGISEEAKEWVLGKTCASLFNL